MDMDFACKIFLQSVTILLLTKVVGDHCFRTQYGCKVSYPPQLCCPYIFHIIALLFHGKVSAVTGVACSLFACVAWVPNSG